MKKHTGKWLQLIVLSLTALLVIGGCGGGGGSSAPPPPAKATISGAVTFPSLGSLVAKRVGSMVDSTDVSVGVYDLAGTEVKTVIPKYDDAIAADARIFSYTFTELDLGKDYIIKAKRNNVVLKKLIEKKDVTENTVGQSINSVSTVAVIVASNQLGAVLGDALPAGKTVSGLSTLINTEIKPVLLEGTIDAVVNAGGTAGVTDANTAAFANVFNIVVTAAVENVDPAAMFTAAPSTLTATVPILTVAAGTVTVTQTTVTAAVVTASADPTYTAPTETASTYNTLANQYLTTQDISNAALNYEKALAIDANDPEANFGGAITSGMMMIEDPDVQAIITKWGAVVPTVNQIVQGTSPIKLPFGSMTSVTFTSKIAAKTAGTVTTATTAQNVLTAFSALKAKLPQQKSGYKSLAKTLNLVPTTAPTISEMQTLIDNVIIPRIDKINARLAKAETATFSFTITKAMQGNPVYGTDVTLDSGELYTLDAALNIFQVLFKIASSYNFDIPSPYTYDNIGQDPLAMINSSTVFTLKSGGLAKMTGALDNARAAAAKAKLAYERVVTRTLGQGMFDLSSWTQLEKDNFVADHAKVTGALVGQFDVKDSSGVKIVTIDATKFFTNPLTRAKLPTFGYDVPRNAALSVTYNSPVAAERTVSHYYETYNATTSSYSYVLSGSHVEPIDCSIVPTSDLPDYTLNGILPGNTAANNVAGFNGILPANGVGVLLHGSTGSYDLAEPYENLSYESDGTNLYRLRQTVDTSASPYQLSTRIQKIDATTGEVTNITGVNENVYKIVHTTGQWWAGVVNFDATGMAFELRKFTNSTTAPWTLNTTADYTIPADYNTAITGVSGSGNYIYYVLHKLDFSTYTSSNEIHKLDVTTSIDTIITTVDNDWINAIEFSNGSIYTSGDVGIEKRDATTGAVVATYANGDFKAMLGGYFYTNNNGKLIKYAGTPAGGTAKAALAKYFGF